MAKISVQTGIKKERFFISFLQKKDFIESVNFLSHNSDFNIENIFYIKSEKSGVVLNFNRLVELSKKIYKQLLLQNQQNTTFSIKNSTFSCYFYLVSETNIPNQLEPLRLFYVWKISTSPTSWSREQWFASKMFPSANCCFRNYFLSLATDSTFQEPLENIEDVDRFCYFPKNQILVNVEFFMNLENPNSLKNQKQLEKLFEEVFVSKMPSGGFAGFTDFLYPREFLNYHLENQQFSSFIKEELNCLHYASLNNPNCKELFSALCLEQTSFERFLFNCLFTVFIKQKNNLKLITEKDYKIKLLSVEFLF